MSYEADRRVRIASTGTVAACAATTMFFAAVASAYFVRRGISSDWTVLALPPVLPASVAPALAISAAVEREREGRASLPFVLGCGALLVSMQAYGLVQLSAVRTPASDFLCIMVTPLMLMEIGGMAAWPAGNREVLRYFWHYMNVIWVLMLAFLSIWR